MMWVHDSIPNTAFFIGFFKFFSTLGKVPIMLFFVSLSTLFYLYRPNFTKAQTMVMASVAAVISINIMKLIVKRPRPELFEHLEKVNGYSFPSGHALATFVIYGLAAYFLAESLPNRRRLIFFITTVLLLLIGLSRLYLGVHWPSDVLGGWLIGTALLAASIWWYHKGGLVRAIRIVLGIIFLVLGIIGLVFPIVPGILLIIAAFILIFSGKPLRQLISELGDRISRGRSSSSS